MKKQIKLTPEEAKTQAEARAAEQARREAEKAAAKAKRQAEQREARLQLRALASMLKAVQPAEQSKLADLDAYIRHDVGSEFLSLDDELFDWAQDFIYNPAHGFEWAHDDFKRAAKHELYAKLVRGLNEKPTLEVLRGLKQDIEHALLSDRWTANSTSAPSNAMEEARRAAASEMLRYTLGYQLAEMENETAAAAVQMPAAMASFKVG